MQKKIISLFTLVAFIVFSISCYITRQQQVRAADDLRGKKGKIVSLVKTSGEHIKFSKKGRGRIYGDNIIGTISIISKKVEIARDNIKTVTRDEYGKILEITHKNGNAYLVAYGSVKVVNTLDNVTGKEEERIVFYTPPYETYESVTISISEVKSVKVKNFDFIVSVFVAGAVVGIALFAIANSGIYLGPEL